MPVYCPVGKDGDGLDDPDPSRTAIGITHGPGMADQFVFLPDGVHLKFTTRINEIDEQVRVETYHNEIE